MGTAENERNYYELLGVERTASEEEIRASYKELVRIFHPDSNYFSEIVPDRIEGDEADTFKLISEAYKVLTDSNKRQNYDRSLPPVLNDWGSDARRPSPMTPEGKAGWVSPVQTPAMDKVAARNRTFGVAQRRTPEAEREIQSVQSVFELCQRRRRGLFERLLEMFGL